MKANSRRRVLISSMAMLLVALVALSTATFAWFTSNTTATAEGLNVKTIQASELVIKSDAMTKYDTYVNYGVNDKVLLPASSANGTNWYTGSAEKKTSYAIADNASFTPVASAGNYYFKEGLSVKNEGDATVKDVTITVSGLTNAYGRIALVQRAQGINKSAGTFANSIYADTDTSYSAVSGTAKTAVTPVTAEGTIEILVGDLAKDEFASYDLYVWFEGQDTDCTDALAGIAIGDIDISVSGTTVDQTPTTVVAQD